MTMTKERVEAVIEEKIAPLLATHGGGITLVSIEDGVVKVKLTGACSTCPSAQETNENLIEGSLMEVFPELKRVELDLSVSEDLLAFARKILKRD